MGSASRLWMFPSEPQSNFTAKPSMHACPYTASTHARHQAQSQLMERADTHICPSAHLYEQPQCTNHGEIVGVSDVHQLVAHRLVVEVDTTAQAGPHERVGMRPAVGNPRIAIQEGDVADCDVVEIGLNIAEHDLLPEQSRQEQSRAEQSTGNRAQATETISLCFIHTCVHACMQREALTSGITS